MRFRYTAWITAAAIAGLTAVTSLTAGPQLGPGSALSPPAATTDAGRCVPAQVQSRTLADAAGRSLSPGRVAATLDTVYRLGPGTMTVATPLPGFSAADASPAERAATGLDALPAAARELAEAPGMRYDPSGTLCLGSGNAGPFSSTSPNWGGVAVYRAGARTAFWQAAASWRIPHFTASCGPDSNHSMWTGIGGFSKSPDGLTRLIQAGVDTAYGDGVSNPDDVYPFWEVLSFRSYYSPNNIQQIVRVPLAMHAGDSITVLTEYLAFPGKVVIWFLDRTTRQYKLYSLTRLYGHAPSFFYDGQSAEVVGENGNGSPYREPAGDVTSFTQVEFNRGQPASAFPAAERLVTMTSTGKRGGRVLDSPSGLSTYQIPGQPLRASRWSDRWRSCADSTRSIVSKPSS
jgi:Peptidase A4 family